MGAPHTEWIKKLFESFDPAAVEAHLDHMESSR